MLVPGLLTGGMVLETTTVNDRLTVTVPLVTLWLVESAERSRRWGPEGLNALPSASVR